MKKQQEENNEVSAFGLKQALWESICGLRDKSVKPEVAHAIAKSANAILKTVQLELEVAKNYKLQSESLKGFITSTSGLQPLPEFTATAEKRLVKASGDEPKRH